MESVTNADSADASSVDVAGQAIQEQIRQILKENWIGPQRALLASLNELRNWSPNHVAALFRFLPPISGRKLYPLGPEFRTLPNGSRRWKELGMKVAMLGAVNTVAVVGSPFLLMATKADREKAVREIKDLNIHMISSSFFVKPSLEMMEQAATSGRVLCVNKWGQFRILDSGYAAISHVWGETLGLEFNDEKSEQDPRGFNMSHFKRMMDIIGRTGWEWIWFDLLAIPRKSDLPTASGSYESLKVLIINSLHNVYRNAEAIIILDGLTLQLSSGDPLDAAALLSCGQWLTRVWTYQEVKLARKAKIITATHVIDFEDMVTALKQQEVLNYPRWHQLRLTFDRLLPHSDVGISLADIAMSCDHRSTTNDVDYARAFFALLRLEWKTGWTYEDGIMEIFRSQPRQVSRIAGMHGPRGLPPPYSWAPKYLVQLQGEINDSYDCAMGMLVGYWYTVAVKSVKHRGYNEPEKKVFFDLIVTDKNAGEVQVQISMFPGLMTVKLEKWIDETLPYGKTRILCSNDLVQGIHCPVVLLATLSSVETPELGVDAIGEIAESAVLNGGSVEATKLHWLLN